MPPNISPIYSLHGFALRFHFPPPFLFVLCRATVAFALTDYNDMMSPRNLRQIGHYIICSKLLKISSIVVIGNKLLPIRIEFKELSFAKVNETRFKSRWVI